MRRFLVTHELGNDEAEKRDSLTRLARVCHEAGLRPVETFYRPGGVDAWTLFEANTERDVLAATERAGLHAQEVVLTERVFTDLLDRPRKARR